MKRFTKFSLLLVSLLLIGIAGVKAELQTVFSIDFTSSTWGSTAITGSNNSGKGSNFSDLNSNSYYGYCGINPTTSITIGSGSITGYLEFGGTARFFLLPAINFIDGGTVTVEWGCTSNRSIGLFFSTPNTATETATDITGDGTNKGTAINYVSQNLGNIASQTFTIANTVNGTKYLRLSATNTGANPSAGSGTYIKSIIVKTNPSGPTISRTTGDAVATGMVSAALNPIVFTWGGAATDATLTWLDAAGGNPTAAPTDIQATKAVGSKTITIDGTPTSARTLYYSVVATDGTNNSTPTTGSIVISPYVTPAPNFELTSAASTTNQVVKDGNSIANITYNITNVKSVTVEGLPISVDYIFVAPVLTISGIANTGLYKAYDYTIKAIASDDYATPNQVFPETGTITVKDPNAKTVAFLYDASVASTALTNANGLYKLVIEPNYDAKTFNANNGNFSNDDTNDILAVGNYDLIVLHESLKSGNTLALTLGTKIDQLPILNTKAHMYSKTNWPAGAGNNGAAVNTSLCVNESYKTHPIFNGVVMTGETNSVSMGDGIIRWVDVTSSTTGNYIANNSEGTTATAVAIIEQNNNTAVDNNKYLLISLSAASENLNSNGALLFKNACEYLMGSTVFAATPTNINTISGDKAIVSVKYYNLTGIEVNENVKGIIIVKTIYEDGSVSTSKVLK